MVAEAEIRCHLCGSGRLSPALAELPLVQRCGDCDLTFSSGDSRSRYDWDYFANGYYRSYFARASQWRFEARRRLRWLLASASPRRLLEIGCAGGFFLDEARRLEIEVCGVELSSVAASYARRELGLRVTQGAFEAVQLPGGFDAVCAFHVLEHVAEPRSFLERAHRLLCSGGLLALEVPNIESAGARRAGARWSDLQPEYHLWHFAPQTLARLVSETGFALERCDTVFARHYRRPATRLSRAGLALLARDWQATGSLRSVHPSLGDHLRLLARKP